MKGALLLDKGQIVFTTQFDLSDKPHSAFIKNQEKISADGDIFALLTEQEEQKMQLSSGKIRRILEHHNQVSKDQPEIALLSTNEISKVTSSYTLLDTSHVNHVKIGTMPMDDQPNTAGLLIQRIYRHMTWEEVDEELANKTNYLTSLQPQFKGKVLHHLGTDQVEALAIVDSLERVTNSCPCDLDPTCCCKHSILTYIHNLHDYEADLLKHARREKNNLRGRNRNTTVPVRTGILKLNTSRCMTQKSARNFMPNKWQPCIGDTSLISLQPHLTKSH